MKVSSQDDEPGGAAYLAIGHCYRDDDGDPAHYPGWFVDVTDHEFSGTTALRLAAHHSMQARDAAKAAHQNLVAYLLDNVLCLISMLARALC